MKKLLNRFQQTMAAVTFAEAGEWETARQMAPLPQQQRQLTWLDRIFMAVTFAEQDLAREALQCLDNNSNDISRTLEGLGIRGVRMVFGTVSIEA